MLVWRREQQQGLGALGCSPKRVRVFEAGDDGFGALPAKPGFLRPRTNHGADGMLVAEQRDDDVLRDLAGRAGDEDGHDDEPFLTDDD